MKFVVHMLLHIETDEDVHTQEISDQLEWSLDDGDMLPKGYSILYSHTLDVQEMDEKNAQEEQN